MVHDNLYSFLDDSNNKKQIQGYPKLEVPKRQGKKQADHKEKKDICRTNRYISFVPYSLYVYRLDWTRLLSLDDHRVDQKDHENGEDQQQ